MFVKKTRAQDKTQLREHTLAWIGERTFPTSEAERNAQGTTECTLLVASYHTRDTLLTSEAHTIATPSVEGRPARAGMECSADCGNACLMEFGMEKTREAGQARFKTVAASSTGSCCPPVQSRV